MDYLQITQNWIEKFVIGLNLCPFASHPFSNGKIRYQLELTSDLEKLAEAVFKEIHFLNHCDQEEVETSILIHPNILNDFLDYNDFLHLANAILVDANLEGEIQIASFHPDYQFAGEAKNAISNYVTRSPFPMLHFLREESVERAIQMHPNTEKIPADNIKTLEGLGIEKIKNITLNKSNNSQ